MAETVLAYLLCVALETGEQLAYRCGAPRQPFARRRWSWIGFGVSLHVAGLTAWLWLLSVLPLGVALPMMGVNYAVIALAGRTFFSERLDTRHWCAIGSIVLGVGLVWLDAAVWK